MTNLHVFTVYDAKADLYLRPFFCDSLTDCKRALMSIFTDENHQFTLYASDFSVYELGFYDSGTGCFTDLKMKFLFSLAELYQEYDYYRRQETTLRAVNNTEASQ